MKKMSYKTFGPKFFIAILIITLTFSLSCKSMKSNEKEMELIGEYQIVKIETDAFKDSFNDSSYVCYFQEDNFIQAFIGCNRIRGGYSLGKDRIEIGPLMSTKMYCRNMATQEMALLNCLEKATKVIAKDKGVSLVGINTEIILKKMVK